MAASPYAHNVAILLTVLSLLLNCSNLACLPLCHAEAMWLLQCPAGAIIANQGS